MDSVHPAVRLAWQLALVSVTAFPLRVAHAQPPGRVTKNCLQSTTADSTETPADTCALQGVGSVAYRRLLNKQFAAVVNPSSNNNVGRFAAYEFKDGRITFASSFQLGEHVLTLGANGAGTDKSLPILGQGDFNTDVGINLQFHRLGLKGQSLTYSTDAWDAYLADSIKAVTQHAATWADARHRGPQARARLRLQGLLRDSTARAAEIARAIARQAVSRASAPPCPRTSSCPNDPVLDSLLATEATAAVERSTVARDTVWKDVRLTIGNERADALTKAEEKLQVKGFSIRWLSIGIGAQSRGFKLFTPANPPASQLKDVSYISVTPRVQYSWYVLPAGRGRSWYATTGVSWSQTDNAENLGKVQITEVTQYDTVTDARRSSKTYDAFAGAYQRGIRVWRAFADYFLFSARDGGVGLHLYPSAERQPGKRTIPTYGVGVVGLFQSPTATRVSAELYYELVDSTSRRFDDNARRGQVGFRFALPITLSPSE